MKYASISYITTSEHNELEKRMVAEKRMQAGIAFPAPRKQDHLLIIRLEVNPVINNKLVSQGLKKLCTLFELIDREIIEIEDSSSEDEVYMYPLTGFNFTATIGFGKTFFRKLDLMKKSPKNLYEMPAHYEIGDTSPYVLPQTDMILQLASNNYTVNKMLLQNDNYLICHNSRLTRDLQYLSVPENGALNIMEAIKGWAKITDAQNGFHRADGKNLMGFYDGISNPYRLANNNIWIREDEEDKEFANGTYMVFQKIEHDLNEWNKLETHEQEKWVGRSKSTGLLLGTLPVGEEKRLISELHSSDSSRKRQAMVRLSGLIDEQRSPTKNFFDAYDVRYLNINKSCPISSHARRVNPRKPNGQNEKFIFRRGCLYMEEDFADYPKSGILFISFQNDIKIFEEMKRNISQHVSMQTKIKQSEKIRKYSDQKASVNNSFNTLTLGGGYYFIPPILNKKISEIGQLFFK
jgi:Dyp-type peroxidase family